MLTLSPATPRDRRHRSRVGFGTWVLLLLVVVVVAAATSIGTIAFFAGWGGDRSGSQQADPPGQRLIGAWVVDVEATLLNDPASAELTPDQLADRRKELAGYVIEFTAKEVIASNPFEEEPQRLPYRVLSDTGNVISIEIQDHHGTALTLDARFRGEHMIFQGVYHRRD